VIQVESLDITEFRGIRKLTLNFNGKSFAICGPNGTGKSGVVAMCLGYPVRAAVTFP
jgi:predicted ATP-dependent endonuclease of OLD family